MLAMLRAGEHLALCGAVALQLIGDDHAGPVGEALEQLAEELLRRRLITPTLHQDIEHIALFSYCPPQIVTLTVDGEEDLVQVPFGSGPGPTAPQLIGIGLPELVTPLADRFIHHGDTTVEQQLFDIAITQTESEVEPHSLADNLNREAMILIGEYCVLHAKSMSCRGSHQQVDNALQSLRVQRPSLRLRCWIQRLYRS
jgi:hypothetical protein